MLPKRRKINIAQSHYEINSVVDLRELEKKSKSELSYELDVEYNGQGFFKKWDKSNFKINGIYVFNKIDEIYLKVSEPVNKLDFYYENGEITKLRNYKAILKEWEVAKENLIEEFYGEVINELIDRTTENYNDLELLKKLLSRDLTLQHLHSSTDLNDSLIYANSSQNKRTYLGVINDIPLTYIENKTLSTRNDLLRLSTNANLKLEEKDQLKLTNYFQSKLDNFEIDNLRSTIHAEFLIDPNSLWIENAQIEHVVEVENNDYKKTITLTIKRIENVQ